MAFVHSTLLIKLNACDRQGV
ncbi:MAG: hypothetical protein ACTS73_06235 [Arsenophonus sp. NEOnobi-MAG3]